MWTYCGWTSYLYARLIRVNSQITAFQVKYITDPKFFVRKYSKNLNNSCSFYLWIIWVRFWIFLIFKLIHPRPWPISIQISIIHTLHFKHKQKVHILLKLNAHKTNCCTEMETGNSGFSVGQFKAKLGLESSIKHFLQWNQYPMH